MIGRILIDALNRNYEITSLDLDFPGEKLPNVKYFVADITNSREIEEAISGQEFVVHLAGDSRLEADWDSVYSTNILGTYNVFEASSRAKVRRIVFASSNHVTGLYEKDWPISSLVKGEYKGIERNKIPMISHLSPPRSDSFYGASKLLGEGLGQYYSSERGVSVICLRIGTVRPYDWPLPSEIRFLATWLSHADLIQLIEKSLEADASVKYDVFYGVSDNTWRFWDISHGRKILDYNPRDNAELHRSE